MGNPYLSKPQTEKDHKKYEDDKIRYVASGMQGWRIGMEDAHISYDNLGDGNGLFGVFDGHGGHEVAKFVERHFKDQLMKNSNYKSKNYDQALIESFFKMDELLLTDSGKKEINQIKGGNDYEPSQAGCTANVLLITPTHLICANAGDSRCVISVNKKAKALSEDHKPDDKIEKDRIHKAGGEVVEGRVNGNLNLSRAMGDLEYKSDSKLKPEDQLISVKPDIKKHDRQQKCDFIIMGCDGIWECGENQQIIDHFEKYQIQTCSLEEQVKANQKFLDENLAENISGMYGLDNMSIISIVLKN